MKCFDLAPVPAFFSIILVNLAKLTAWLQALALLIGCAVSAAMFIAWCYKAKREKLAEKLAELKLQEAEKLAAQKIKDAEVKAAKIITDVAAALKV
jgi:hypothetical protein